MGLIKDLTLDKNGFIMNAGHFNGVAAMKRSLKYANYNERWTF